MVLASTDYLTDEHIEAARVYIQTLTSSHKHLKDHVVRVAELDADICTVEMLRAIIDYEWLNGAVSMSTFYSFSLVHSTAKILITIYLY